MKAIYVTVLMLLFAGSIFAQNQNVGINNNIQAQPPAQCSM